MTKYLIPLGKLVQSLASRYFWFPDVVVVDTVGIGGVGGFGGLGGFDAIPVLPHTPPITLPRILPTISSAV
jgi:hypothetical protein